MNNPDSKSHEEVKMSDLEVMDNAISQVIDTFKFHGIEIASINLLEDGCPEVNIKVSTSKRFKPLDDTLNFAYWTLWTLLYGSYSEDKNYLKLELNYEEVE